MSESSYEKAPYELGKKLSRQYKTYTDVAHAVDLPAWWGWLEWELFEIGFRNLPLKEVHGWRYGAIPPDGRSTNHRDNTKESGVSFYMDNDDEAQDFASTLFIRAGGRPKVRVKGILNPLRRGADNEPLLLIAQNECMNTAKDIINFFETIYDNREDKPDQPSEPKIQKWPEFGAKTKLVVLPDGSVEAWAWVHDHLIWHKKFECETHADDTISGWLDNLSYRMRHK